MTFDWFEQNGFMEEIIEPVVVRWLCEQDKIVLRYDTIYKFEVKPECGECVELAKIYGYQEGE